VDQENATEPKELLQTMTAAAKERDKDAFIAALRTAHRVGTLCTPKDRELLAEAASGQAKRFGPESDSHIQSAIVGCRADRLPEISVLRTRIQETLVDLQSSGLNQDRWNEDVPQAEKVRALARHIEELVLPYTNSETWAQVNPLISDFEKLVSTLQDKGITDFDVEGSLEAARKALK
jgi:hypothetical protein